MHYAKFISADFSFSSSSSSYASVCVEKLEVTKLNHLPILIHVNPKAVAVIFMLRSTEARPRQIRLGHFQFLPNNDIKIACVLVPESLGARFGLGRSIEGRYIIGF